MFESLRPWLSMCGADVLCLQEVTRTPGVSGWTTFRDAERELPQRANLFDDVRTELPRHQGVFAASDAGPVRTGGSDLHQEFGVAMFVDDRLTVIEQRAVHVHGAFVDHHEWATADRPRVAQAARVLDRTMGRVVAVVHLHGLRDPAGKGDTPARRRQAERVVEVVDTIRDPGDLTVVCGDLNLLPDSETFSLLGEIGLHDLVGRADTRTSRYEKPVRHANYLLMSAPEAVVRFETPAVPEVSDHRPLILDI